MSRTALVFSLPAPAVATHEAWSWEQYLKEQEAVAAPVELFSKVNKSLKVLQFCRESTLKRIH